MEEVLAFLNAIATQEGWPLQASCIEYLKKVIKSTTVKKEEFVLEKDEVCKNLYFIKKGLLKCFYMHRDQEVCDWFFGPMEAVVAIDSFYDQKIGTDYIQASEDSELLYISFAELTYLYRNFVEFNVVGRVLTLKYLRIWHRQARNIRMLTAEERYNYVLENQPGLVNLIPVKDLASHIGMRPETLSRMRGRLH